MKRHKNWIFTWNNYNHKNINSLENQQFVNYIFQPEIGDSGTPHLQGCLLYKTSKSFTQLKSKFPQIHLEPMKYKKEAIAYCMKSESKAGPRYTNMQKYEEIQDVLCENTPYKWQQNIINIVSEDPDPRIIHWVWEPIGCRGKTILCKHLVLKYNAIIVGGRCRDAMYAITKRLEQGKPTRIVVFDIPRSSMGRLSYPALEKIKDGLFFSSKYESGMVCINIPHVLVFANSPPNTELLSLDRWNIIALVPDEGSTLPGGERVDPSSSITIDEL